MRKRAVSRFEPQRAFALTRACSLAKNNLTNYGGDMSGVIALAAALKDSQISILK